MRVTFIRDDGETERCGQVTVLEGAVRPQIEVPVGVAPSWAGVGTEVVVATDNGGVVEAFTVEKTETRTYAKSSPPTHRPPRYRVFIGPKP